MLYGRLLDKNTHCREPLADLSYPVVLLQGRKGGSDRFIEGLSGDLYGVLNVLDILYRNCARSEDHKPKRSIFAFCSPLQRASREDFWFPRESARSTANASVASRIQRWSSKQSRNISLSSSLLV